MARNDLEVFEHLTSADDTPLPIDFLTYAIFAHEKSEWIAQYTQKNNAAPSRDEIDNWIDNLTDSQFAGMRATAEGFFDVAANEYLEERLRAERLNILRDAIVGEVRAAGSFRKQLGVAMATTILVPVLLGVGIAALFYVDKTFPTVVSVFQRMTDR